MAEQVWSRGSIIEGGVPGVLAALSVPTDQTCALCMRRPDYFASLNYVERRADEPYCSDCLDDLIEQSGPIIERLIPLSGDNGDGTAISRDQFAAILRGEPVVFGKRRRLLTLADGPFVVIERHHGPGPHPGTGTPQDVHGGEGAGTAETKPQYVMATGEDQDARLLDWHPESQHLLWIDPRVYLSEIARDLGPGYSQRDVSYGVIERKIGELRDRMRDGLPIDALWVDAELNEEGTDTKIVRQEGRHRAWAAIDLGIRSVPVITYFRSADGYYHDLKDEPLDLKKVHPWRNVLDASVARHHGPGPHPGTGTSQKVHGGGSRAEFSRGGTADVIESLPKTERWNVIRRAYDAIDSIHATTFPDGFVAIPWKENRSKTRGGTFTYDRKNGPVQVSYNLRDDAEIDNYPMTNAVHEYGHFTDMLLGATMVRPDQYSVAMQWDFASEAFTVDSEHPLRDELRALGEAIRDSDGAQSLFRWNRRSWNDGFGNIQTFTKRQRDSLKTNVEFFARAYTQWITTRSGNDRMRHELRAWRDGWRRGGGPDLQWDDDDFEPIGKAMDDLFDAAGLLK